LGEHIASIFRVEKAKQDTNMEAGGKLSNQLAGYFGLYREGNEIMALSSHWLAVGQNETAGLPHCHQAKQHETRTGAHRALKRGVFAGLGKTPLATCFMLVSCLFYSTLNT
jgi:hypothetical protein